MEPFPVDENREGEAVVCADHLENMAAGESGTFDLLQGNRFGAVTCYPVHAQSSGGVPCKACFCGVQFRSHERFSPA